MFPADVAVPGIRFQLFQPIRVRVAAGERERRHKPAGEGDRDRLLMDPVSGGGCTAARGPTQFVVTAPPVSPCEMPLASLKRTKIRAVAGAKGKGDLMICS
jgi:hypothetical protein